MVNNFHPRLIINQLTKCLEISKSLQEQLINTHGCGWFDGGCYTLAAAVSEVVPGTTVYHISRATDKRDHAVLKIEGIDLYFDADGIATDGALFKKMRVQELTDCTVLEPFLDFDIHVHTVFQDIKQAFINQYNLKN